MFCDLRVPEPVDRDAWIQHMKKRTILIWIILMETLGRELNLLVVGFGAVAWEQSCSSPKDLSKVIGDIDVIGWDLYT